MSQKEPVIWDARCSALENTITDMLDAVEKYPEDWAVTIASALKCLRAFGKTQFDFFQAGFLEKNLVDSPKYKAEFALRQTLDQIAYDLSVLQRAFSQRHPDLTPRRQRDTLELADRLAYRALKPAIEGGMLPDTAVITYFQKATHVRVVPYAPVAIIGIPYACTGIFDEVGSRVLDQAADGRTHTARDFLAIAHEAGHHVFWHGKNGRASLRAVLRSKLSAEPAYRMAWLEEIFADVYGAVVAGPVLALDFQELLYDNLDLMADDGAHPVDVVRPYIYTETLRQITDPAAANGVADELDKQWQALIGERMITDRFVPKNGHGSTPVLLTDAVKSVQEAVNIILKELTEVLGKAQISRWSADDAIPDLAAYETFREQILKLADLRPKKLTAVAAAALQTASNDPDAIPWEIGKPLVRWLNIFQKAVAEEELTLLPETWQTLLEGGGWAAGGPEGNTNPPG